MRLRLLQSIPRLKDGFSCEASPHNLTDILDTLRAADVALGRVWSEPPTLNDVFLEITGRELRD